MTVNFHEVGSPKLTERARKYCDDREIPPAMRKLANLRSLRPSETAELFHVRREALLIPVAPDYGVARVYDLPKDQGKFRSPAGMPSRIYEPPMPPRSKLTRERIRKDPKVPLFPIEGWFKALAASGQGLPSIGFQGTWGWQKRRVPFADLARYVYNDRTVGPIFDADVADNWLVAMALLELGDWLVGLGATVNVKEMPRVAGRTTGIDDFLARRGAREFLALPAHAWDSDYVHELRSRIAPFTDGGNARRLVYRHGDDLRRDVTAGQWLVWHQNRWQIQPPGAPDVQERMRATVAELFHQAAREAKEDRRKALRKWATTSDSARGIRDAIALAASDPSIRVAPDELDRNPLLLGVANGVVDLATGKHRAAKREDLITRQAGTAFDADATCPRWLAFIDQITAHDAERAAFLQRLAGYSLTGTNPERRIFELYGGGANGKSVYIETLLSLLGEYGVPTKTDILMTGRRDADPERPTPFLVSLRGARLVTASEVGDGSRLNESLIKDLTGDDTITARALKTSPVRFRPGFKVLVRANHKPIVQGDDDAIWDRITLVPFDVRIAEKDRDPKLGAAIRAELPGVLNWALVGCRAVLRDGLQIPEFVRDASRSYRTEMDSFAQWLDESTLTGPTLRGARRELSVSYKTWCEVNATHPLGPRRFRQKLEERGFEIRRSYGLEHVLGLRLLTMDEHAARSLAAERQLDATEIKGRKGGKCIVSYMEPKRASRESNRKNMHSLHFPHSPGKERK